jgi:hypothetical protein
MAEKSKKELQVQYKDREIIGGVYAIKNNVNGKMLIDAGTDLRGLKNRFGFAVKTGSCIYLKMQNDWTAQRGAGFDFEVLEELKKDDAQTAAQFRADLSLLKQMWVEKLSDNELY